MALRCPLGADMAGGPSSTPSIVSWDCGAGSFQICDGEKMFGRPIGSLTSFKALLAIQGRAADGRATGNPATLEQVGIARERTHTSDIHIQHYMCTYTYIDCT